MDILTSQAAEAYLREETRLRTQSGRAARDLVERLINGEPVDARRRHPARDALEEGMSLGAVKPLVTIRHGELVLICPGAAADAKTAGVRDARRRTIEEHDTDVRYGISVPSRGFESVQQAYREATLSLWYTSPSRPIVSLADLSALECALIGATSTTKAIVASKGNALRTSTRTPCATDCSRSPRKPVTIHARSQASSTCSASSR
jgi:hypothetical protein